MSNDEFILNTEIGFLIGTLIFFLYLKFRDWLERKK